MAGWAASAALVAWVAGADVPADPPRVDVRAALGDPAASGPLFEWLVVRLLEEGYALAGGDDADVDLEIGATSPTAWIVRATGQSSHAFDVTLGDDPSVLRLELLHRAVDALAAAGRRESITLLRAPMFAVELSGTVEASEELALRGAIAIAILGGGGAVAPARASANHTVCVAPGVPQPAVTLVAAHEPCPDLGPHVAPVTAAAMTAALVRTVVSSTRFVPLDDSGLDDEVAPGLRRGATRPAAARHERPVVVRGGAAVGFVARNPALDAAVTTSLFIGREPGPSAWIDLQLWPSTRNDGLVVFETVPAVGLRLRPATMGRFSVDLGALLGLQTHTYGVDRASLHVDGVAADVSGEAAIGFALRVWRDHEVQLLVRGGLSGRRREHTDRDEVLWRRGAARIVTTLGMAFGRRLSR